MNETNMLCILLENICIQFPDKYDKYFQYLFSTH